VTERLHPSRLPLTEAQAGLWYAQRLDPANPVYNTGDVLDLRGPLDVEAFRAAVDGALGEADVLAIRVVETADGVWQEVREDARPRMMIEDLRARPDAEDEARTRMRRDLETPVDPSRDPLAATRLFILGPERHLWYLRIHHLATDAYGTALLIRRVCERYAAEVEGTPPPPALAPFAALVEEAEAYQGSEKWKTDRDFWLAELEDAPDAVSLVPGNPPSAHTYLRHAAELPAGLAAALRALSAEARVSWPDALAALVAAYLHRHLGGAEVTVGMLTMNRLGSVAARVPATAMNVLPVRVAVDEDAPVAAFVAATARRMALARRHGRYRGEQLRRDLRLLGGERRLHGPLINVLPFDEEPALPGVVATREELASGPVEDLTVDVRTDAAGDRLRLQLQAHPGRYPAPELAAHAERLATFLARAASARRLAKVPTLTEEEDRHWTRGINRRDHPVRPGTLVERMEAAMRRWPERTAVEAGARILTYAELDARSAALAARLAAEGVRRGDVVGVAVPRSTELAVALVAVLRAGAAYLPLDAADPPARLASALAHAAPRILLAAPALRHRLPAETRVMELDGIEVPGDGDRPHPSTPSPPAPEEHAGTESADRADRHPPRLSFAPPEPEDAAYVLFTSGSTGAPKGVAVEHRSIVNRLEWMRAHYGIGGADRVLQKTPVTFDVSVWELFLPLIAGATLVMAPPDAHRDPAWLAAVVRESGATTMHFVPSMLAAFLDEPSAGAARLRRVFASGEALPAGLRDRFHARLSGVALHNLYGPTEAAVDVTWWDASAGDRSAPVPIGCPVWNTAMYVLDARMRPVPPGVAGELYIGGVQVARGYVSRPGLTAERFLPDPFGAEGARMYRTGDRARWRADGALDFLGRADRQAKVRGVRIEPGEVEAVLADAPGVARAAVVVREDRPGDARLVAYLVPRGGTGEDDGAPVVDLAAVRAHAATRLPEAMRPAAYVTLDALPLTRSGKLDRAALPAPSVSAVPSAEPPRTPAERRVAALFAEVLGVPDVGPADDFFLLGGHSLLAARLAARLREGGTPGIGLGAVFAHPTVRRLAAHLDALASVPGMEGEGLGPLIALSGGAEDGRAPLFCIHPAGGIAWSYRPLAAALTPRRAVHGLQAPGLDPRVPLPPRLDDLAAEYTARVRVAHPRGPYHLAGWSVGGIIAHAMAVRLRAEGAAVGVVALLDAYPADCWRDEPEPDQGAALRALLQIAGHDPAAFPAERLTREGVVAFLREGGSPLGSLPASALEGVVRVVEHNSALVRGHHHERFDGRVLHFRAALDHAGTELSPDRWRPYAKVVEVHDVPALHPHMVQPAAAARIAAVLGARMKEAEG